MFSSRSRFSCSASPFHSPLHSLEGKECCWTQKLPTLAQSCSYGLAVWAPFRGRLCHCRRHSKPTILSGQSLCQNPKQLFSQCPLMGDFFTYVVDAELYLGLIWLISYLWINQHIWYPKVNLCQINHLLQQLTLCNNVSIFISLESPPGHFWADIWHPLVRRTLHRPGVEDNFKLSKLIPFPRASWWTGGETEWERWVGFLWKLGSRQMSYIWYKFIQVRLDELEETEEEMARDYLSFPKREAASSKRGSVKASDTTTRIYACATMWHETEDEMLEMLKSIFRWEVFESISHALHRVDSDYSKRRLAQKYFGVVDPDYYEWESHILFDDSHKDTVFKKRTNCEIYLSFSGYQRGKTESGEWLCCPALWPDWQGRIKVTFYHRPFYSN